MIDEITRENAMNDVRNGMSYLQASKLHGVEDTAVERWCRDVGVRSLQASKWKTDKEILKAVEQHKVSSCHELAKTLRCTYVGLNKRLRIMVKNGKIQSFRPPSIGHAVRPAKIYYISKDDFAEWQRRYLGV